MPDWLVSDAAANGTLTSGAVAVRLAVSLLYGGAVGAIYRLSHGRDGESSRTLVTTIVLLSVLIAMVTMVIGSSVARAFSLVGALSIVRFRTVVEDTRDTAFVIFAVVVGMAAGTGWHVVPVIGIPIAGAAAVLLHRVPSGGAAARRQRSVLVVRLGLGRDPATALGETLARHAAHHGLLETSTARQGAALAVTYEVTLRPGADPATLVTELNRLDGVQGVEWRSA